MNHLKVSPIEKKEYKDFLLQYHYLKRLPNVKYAFGLYENTELIGVLVYGRLCNPGIVNKLVDEEFTNNVLELNRMCLKYNRKNEASFFIGKTLSLLPKDMIILSYADTDQNHIGTIYKATNFKYYGVTTAKKECYLPGIEGLHSRSAFTYAKKYNLTLEYRQRSTKHRYIYVTGINKEFIYSVIKYEELSYPTKN